MQIQNSSGLVLCYHLFSTILHPCKEILLTCCFCRILVLFLRRPPALLLQPMLEALTDSETMALMGWIGMDRPGTTELTNETMDRDAQGAHNGA
jgi:hypothetical protein